MSIIAVEMPRSIVEPQKMSSSTQGMRSLTLAQSLVTREISQPVGRTSTKENGSDCSLLKQPLRRS